MLPNLPAICNIKPSKKKSNERIDCIVALVMAIGRLIAIDGTEKKSVYEDRGLLIFQEEIHIEVAKYIHENSKALE